MAIATAVPDNEKQESESSLTTWGQMKAEAKMLDAIFWVAQMHDRECQRNDAEVNRLLDLDRPLAEVRGDLSGSVTAAETDRMQLCALLAVAALRRVERYQPLAGHLAHDVFESLEDHEREALVRPIFEESGIGHRFVPRN
jgi:hypothetical protein